MRNSLRLGQEGGLSMIQFLKRLSTSSQRRLLVDNDITGYERSDTLWFSTKSCGCYSTKTHVKSVILIPNLYLNSMRNLFIIRCVVLNEDHFKCICFSAKSKLISVWGSRCLHTFLLCNNYMTSLTTTTYDASFVPSGNAWLGVVM